MQYCPLLNPVPFHLLSLSSYPRHPLLVTYCGKNDHKICGPSLLSHNFNRSGFQMQLSWVLFLRIFFFCKVANKTLTKKGVFFENLPGEGAFSQCLVTQNICYNQTSQGPLKNAFLFQHFFTESCIPKSVRCS